jgi:hypothetical protein
MNLYSQVAAPLFQLATAAHDANNGLQPTIDDFEANPEKFDKLKEDWGHYSTVDDQVVNAILDRVTRNEERR